MSRAVSSRAPWQPQTAQERDAILCELREVVASSYFCNSKRYPALLQYIVENTLQGKTDLLKERTLGIEVFDRPSTYDTNAETVVRFTAGEVRKRLQLYYHERGRSSRVRISLPVVPTSRSFCTTTMGRQIWLESTVVLRRIRCTMHTFPRIQSMLCRSCYQSR